jgi:hypothetical protein
MAIYRAFKTIRGRDSAIAPLECNLQWGMCVGQ